MCMSRHSLPWVRSPSGASSGCVSMIASVRGDGAPVLIISQTSMPSPSSYAGSSYEYEHERRRRRRKERPLFLGAIFLAFVPSLSWQILAVHKEIEEEEARVVFS
jgi:hypothetical protein